MKASLDISVILAIVVLFFSAAASIIYGILHWNKDGEISKDQLQEEAAWDKEENQINREL